METIDEIKEKITSTNIEVLKACNEFLDQRIEKERLRGDAAERRANIILSIVGAASAILIFLAQKLPPPTIKEPSTILSSLIYATSAIWLARAIWYSSKAIKTQSNMMLLAESIYEFQANDESVALKEILTGKLWELQRAVPPNTERLFYVQRAQRALTIFMGWLFFNGGILLLSEKLSLYIVYIIGCLGAFAAFFLFFFGDKIIEKKGIWKWN